MSRGHFVNEYLVVERKDIKQTARAQKITHANPTRKMIYSTTFPFTTRFHSQRKIQEWEIENGSWLVWDLSLYTYYNNLTLKTLRASDNFFVMNGYKKVTDTLYER